MGDFLSLRGIKTLVFLMPLLLLTIAGCNQAQMQVVRDDARIEDTVSSYSKRMIEEGRDTFRHETFGGEAFWGDALRLHEAIAGEKNNGVGRGLSPRAVLDAGLKIDVVRARDGLLRTLKDGTSPAFDDPATTIELLKTDAIVGLKGFFDAKGGLRSIGINCSLCHSTVDNAHALGVGNRLDGWPNRDLDFGRIMSLSPNLKVISDRIGVDTASVAKTLAGWGPGMFDPRLLNDGKGIGADAKGATLIPSIFGLAGVGLNSYTGMGSLAYWNAYEVNTQMRGKGTFFDVRLSDDERFPVSFRTGDWSLRNAPDAVTPKLAALNFFELALPAPTPPVGYFDAAAAERGRAVFEGKAACAKCHVPPLYTEPGWPMHSASSIGADGFIASRSYEGRLYRTTPLKGLFTKTKGGFYHDGRFKDLRSVVDHYNELFHLDLTRQERTDLVEFLRSL